MKEIMNDMTDLDAQLRNALRREAPPAGFTDRVLGRVAAGEVIRLKPDPTTVERHTIAKKQTWDPPLGGSVGRTSFVRWAAAAALVAAVAGGIQYRAIQKERREGEAAKARVVLALHIAGSKLQLVQTKINRMHEQPEKNSNQ